MTLNKTMHAISSSIRWYDGMPVGPQCFQEAFMRSEDLTRFRISLTHPYSYGITKLKIDEEMLNYNVLRISELECILPDGLEVQYLYGVDKILELKLSSFHELIQKGPHKIYLCVPFGKQIGSQDAKYARFHIMPSEIANDIHTDGAPVGISRYRANLSLHIDTLPPPEFISLPLAMINLDKNKFELNSYLPPSLILRKNDEIYRLCGDVLKKLKIKYDLLVQQYKKTFVELDKYSDNIFHLINIIRPIISKLELTLNLPYIAPFELYSQMVSVYSQVICIDHSFSKEIVPSYDHENILEIFNFIIKMIFDHIEVEIPDHFSVCYFDKYQDYFKTILNTAVNTDELMIGFRKNDSFTDNDFLAFIDNLLICERSNFSAMREIRSLGFDRKYVKSEKGLFLSKNIFLFSVNIKKEQIHKNSEIVIFSNSNDFQSLEKNSIILYSKAVN